MNKVKKYTSEKNNRRTQPITTADCFSFFFRWFSYSSHSLRTVVVIIILLINILPFSNVYHTVCHRYNGTIFSPISINFILCNCESQAYFIAAIWNSSQQKPIQFDTHTANTHRFFFSFVSMRHKISIRYIESSMCCVRTHKYLLTYSRKNFNEIYIY